MHLPKLIQQVFNKATCVHPREAVENALDEMAKSITARLENENPVILPVMIGGMIPAGQLVTRLNFPLELDYIHATRYRSGLRGGEIEWKAEPKTSLKDRTVLIIDDVLDGGLTLGVIVDYCKNAGAKDVLTAVLVDKHHPREPGGVEKADFTGLTVEDRYIFGYGLDYKEYLRNAPGIYYVAPEHEG